MLTKVLEQPSRQKTKQWGKTEGEKDGALWFLVTWPETLLKLYSQLDGDCQQIINFSL